jgi:molybdate/tungstate transport system substrate-binding protein
MKKLALLLVVLLVAPSGGALASGPEKTLTIFHAGSLSVPFSRISAAFEKENPGVRVEREAAGSRTCARKISDLNRPCDVMASADYTVINRLLIPAYASWNIRFASNEMVIAYRPSSACSRLINGNNWYEIMQRKDVSIGRSDPNSDPCGYRSVMTCRLAELYYKRPGLARRLLNKDLRNIRPKETDLLALLEAGEIDYLFIYRSVARQHGLQFVVLPDEINLKNPEFSRYYARVSVRISGKRPGTWIVKKGAPMVYGVTIPGNAPHPGLAERFVEFLLAPQKGMKIMEDCGQPSVIPSVSLTFASIPGPLKKYARPPAPASPEGEKAGR